MPHRVNNYFVPHLPQEFQAAQNIMAAEVGKLADNFNSVMAKLTKPQVHQLYHFTGIYSRQYLYFIIKVPPRDSKTQITCKYEGIFSSNTLDPFDITYNFYNLTTGVGSSTITRAHTTGSSGEATFTDTIDIPEAFRLQDYLGLRMRPAHNYSGTLESLRIWSTQIIDYPASSTQYLSTYYTPQDTEQYESGKPLSVGMLHDMQVGTDRMFLDNNNCIFNWSKHEQKTGLRNLDSYQAELFRIPYNLREGTSQVRFFIWAQNITAVGDYPVLQVFMRNQFVGEFTVTNSIRTAWNAPQLHTTAAVTNVAGLRNGDIYVALKTTSATQRLCELIQVSIFEE